MSIKSQIIRRLLELAEPLVAEGKFRKCVRQSAILLQEATTPAIHLVIGDEHMAQEDDRGYWLQFPVTFQLIISDHRAPYDLADTSVAYLQEKMESDPQLSQLATKIVYDGEMPLTTETQKPVGYTLVMYIVEYRRPRANPSQNY